MPVNDEMLEIAMKKAVEAGLLPRHPSLLEQEMNSKIMRDILQAAIAVSRLQCENNPQSPH